jgi:hypothetical protein
LRSALLKLDRINSASDLMKKTLRTLGSFVAAMKLKYDDIELSIDLGKQEGVADSGDLDNDLMELFIALGETAKSKKTAFVLFIDEIQYLPEEQFSALIAALHKCTQLRLPVLLIGAGLPQVIGLAARAKSYAERLFEYTEIGALDLSSAKAALELPANELNVAYQSDAIAEILSQTHSYPYFLQEWGKHSWASAMQSPITLDDVKLATKLAVTELDNSFFRARFDRLTPTEKKYLRAMAELNGDAIRSGDIAHLLKKDVKTVAPIRATLIAKGMIYSSAHGDNAFTVPLFQDYMKRVMPNFYE